MKKGITIVLLACLFLNSGGYWLYIKCMQAQRRNEVMASLRLRQDVPGQEVFEFATLQNDEPTDPAFERENSHEFYFHGKLYDIIEQQVTEKKLLIRCLEDGKEESLLKKLEQAEQRQHTKGGKENSLLQQLISFVFIGAEPDTAVTVMITVNDYQIHYCTNPLPVCKEVNTPPPRV